MAKRKEVPMTEFVGLRVHPGLVREADKKADAAGMTRNEFWAKVLAEHLGCPELGRIPRKLLGRKRKELEPA